MSEYEKTKVALVAARGGSDLELQRAAIEYTREMLCTKLGYRHSDLDLDAILTEISDGLR